MPPKLCVVCKSEMPTWATRCSKCDNAKFENELKLQQEFNKKSKQKFTNSVELTEAAPQGILLEPIPVELVSETTEVRVIQVRIEINALYLGGTGAKIERGSKGSLVINDLGFFFKGKKDAWSVGLTGLKSFQISGAGAFQTGGGWFGGGFGFSGAMQGAAMASMMNLLTTRTHFDCLLRILYDDLDLTFQILDRTPRQLEIDLTGLKYLVSASQTSSNEEPSDPEGVDVLLKLSVLYEKGLLSREEFDEQKKIYLKKQR